MFGPDLFGLIPNIVEYETLFLPAGAVAAVALFVALRVDPADQRGLVEGAMDNAGSRRDAGLPTS
jgi:hypothetical protein